MLSSPLHYSFTRRGAFRNITLFLGAAGMGLLSSGSSCSAEGVDATIARQNCEQAHGSWTGTFCLHVDAGGSDAGSMDTALDASAEPEPACPIPAGRWSSSGSGRGIVRSLAVGGAVFAISEKVPTVPLEKLALDSGASAGKTEVERPSASGQLHERLQIVTTPAGPEIFVSFLGVQAGETRTGGLARVGSISAALPSSVSLVAGFAPSVDGVFASIGDPTVISYASPTATAADIGALGTTNVTPQGTLVASPNGTTRTFGVHAGGALVGLIRKDDLQPTWRGWLLSNLAEPIQPVTLPGSIVDATAHDSLPKIYALTTDGVLTEYAATSNTTHKERDVGTLPQGFTAASNSFARMTYAHGSVFFPGHLGGAPRLVRMRVDTGATTSWHAVRPDHSGWSALAVGDGIACYGDDVNAVHCGCLAAFR